MTERLLLTVDQAAEVANVSRERIDRWARLPGFPVIREGQLVRVHARLLDVWLAQWAESGADDPPTEIKINAPLSANSRGH